ncbi:MAG: CoA transferase [Cellvibrionales bacterium]|nr:CoA transferase [Cellvibrionales bacterium]
MLPLAGVRILEAAQVFAGPHGGSLLSLLGAEVLKIEPPSGDQVRGYAVGFRAQNAGKRSLVLDLKSTEGQVRFRELIKDADILLENFRPGNMDKLGLSHPALRQINPALVQVSISGFGSKGPWAQQPGFDGMMQALVGMLDSYAPEGSNPANSNPESSDPESPNPAEFKLPQYMPVAADTATGLVAAIGALAGLANARKTGVGCHIETSLFESALDLMLVAVSEERNNGPLTAANADQPRAPIGTKPAFSLVFPLTGADGGRMVMMLATSQALWQKLTEIPDFAALSNDARFATYGERVANYPALTQELQQRFATKPRQVWLDSLAGFPISPYNSPAEVAFHEQIEALDLFHFEPEHREWLWRGPWTVNGIRPARRDQTPQLGSATGWLADSDPS